MRASPIIIASLLLAGCGTVPAQPEQRTPRQQELFNRLIANRVAGPPATCIPSWNQNGMTIIDGRTIGFGNGASVSNVINLSQGCESLARGNYALQTNSFGQGLCTGDIARVFDTSMGMVVGSCVVQSIIPYARVKP